MKSPAYQWYPKDILGSARVQEMSLAEEGAYRRLLDFCWLSGSVPADKVRAARVIGKNCSVEIAEIVLEMFETDPNDPDRMIHARLEEERAKQTANSEARRKASEARWTKSAKTGDATGREIKAPAEASKCNANALQMESIAIASASAKEKDNSEAELSKKRGTRISDPFLLTDKMRQYAKDRRPDLNVELETEKFCNYWRAKTGRDATKHDWLATWQNWILNARSNGHGKIERNRPSNADVMREQRAALEPLRGIDPIKQFAIKD